MARTVNVTAYRLLLVELIREGAKTGYDKEPVITTAQCKRLGTNYRVGAYSFKALVKYGVFHKERETGRFYFKAPRDFSIGNEGTAEEIYFIAKEMYYKEHPYVPKEKSPKEPFIINEDGSITMEKKDPTLLSEASLDEIFEEVKSRGYIMYITKAWSTTGKEYLTVRLKLGAW